MSEPPFQLDSELPDSSLREKSALARPGAAPYSLLVDGDDPKETRATLRRRSRYLAARASAAEHQRKDSERALSEARAATDRALRRERARYDALRDRTISPPLDLLLTGLTGLAGYLFSHSGLFATEPLKGNFTVGVISALSIVLIFIARLWNVAAGHRPAPAPERPVAPRPELRP